MDRLLLLVVASLGCLVLLLMPELLILPFKPLIGVVSAPARIFDRWHPEPVHLALFGAALLVVLAGGHCLARWLFTACRAKAGPGKGAASQWRLVWTLAGFGVCFCLLLAVGSAVLIIHQTYWLRLSGEPWLVDPRQGLARRVQLMNQIQDLVATNNWAAVPIRRSMSQIRSGRGGEPFWEQYQVIYAGQASGQLDGILLVPRQWRFSRNARLVLFRRGVNCSQHELAMLPELLSALGFSANNALNQIQPFPISQ